LRIRQWHFERRWIARKLGNAPDDELIPEQNPDRCIGALAIDPQGVTIMANAQRKPSIVPDPAPDHDPNLEEPVSSAFPVNERAEPADRSTGFIIAALVVVLGILFVLSFDWGSTSTAPVVTQDSAAPVTPAPETPPASVTPQ
jgi:hypothetical protein